MKRGMTAGAGAAAAVRPRAWRQRFSSSRAVELLDVVIVDAGEHVGGPGLRIDVVEPRSLDQRVHHGGALAAVIGTTSRCKPPGFIKKGLVRLGDFLGNRIYSGEIGDL